MGPKKGSKYMGQNKWVKRDRNKETGPKGQIQIDGSKKTGPRRHNGPNISKLVQYGPKSNQKCPNGSGITRSPGLVSLRGTSEMLFIIHRAKLLQLFPQHVMYQ